MTRIERLRHFLSWSAARKFDWLVCNCGFWVCDWIASETGNDPVARYRGRFKTEAGFRRFVARHGGTEGFSRMVAAKAGLELTDEPVLGDVGLVLADGITMAIKAEAGNWIVKRSGLGIAIGPFRRIVAWSV